VANGWVGGYDLPSRYLPSRKMQEQRRAALPDAATLARNLQFATRDLPFREGLFAPFLEAVEQTRAGPLLTVDALRGSALELKVNTLLVNDTGEWLVLVPVNGVRAPADLAAAAATAGAQWIDLKAEANALVSGYRDESLKLIALGLAAIAVLLAVGLRSFRAAVRVLAPVLAAVLLDVAVLLMAGTRLTMFHLVALLLVVGIGLNYALFFSRPAPDAEERRRTLLSLIVCGATTLVAFGCLALSRTPVLHAIGVTVALGTMLAFAIAAALSGANPALARGGSR